MAFELSADRVYNLYVHQPRWRLYILLRFVTILISIITVVCFALVLLESKVNPGSWSTLGLYSEYYEWIFFVPVSECCITLHSETNLVMGTRRDRFRSYGAQARSSQCSLAPRR